MKTQKNPPVVYRGDQVIIKTKKRTFNAKAVREFSPMHSLIYPVKDLDGGGRKLAVPFQDVISIERIIEDPEP